MASNSKFAIAVHTLGVLAVLDGKPVSSEMIAGSVGTNPVVIRRIIRKFVDRGLVEVQMGTGGGSKLTREPENIPLSEIYLALEEDELFQVPMLPETHGCPVGRLIRPVLQNVFTDIEHELVERLVGISLRDVMNKVLKAMGSQRIGECLDANE